MDSLKREVDDAKTAFQDRLQSFVRSLKTVETNQALTIEELKKTYTKETADLVQRTNQSYNSMLAQRMAEEDKLRAELTAAQQRDTLSAQQQTEIEKRLKAARDSERAAMQKELRDMKDRADAATKAGAAREAEAASHMLKLNQELAALQKMEVTPPHHTTTPQHHTTTPHIRPFTDIHCLLLALCCDDCHCQSSLTLKLDASKRAGDTSAEDIKRLQTAAQKTDALLLTANTELAAAQNKLKV